MTGQLDVLVVGAGPTGLTLALQAHANGATVRVVERREEAGRPSRALLLHARTLEVLRPLGVVDDLLDRGRIAPTAFVHVRGRTVAVATDAPALTDSPYGHLTLLRQADLEVVLAAALAERGVEVERGVTVTGLDQHPGHGVRVVTDTPAVPGGATCRYLVGCDGAASTVRAALGVPWRGSAYRTEVVLADVELEKPEPSGDLHVCVGPAGLLFLFPCGERATWRLLATRPTRSSTVDFVPGELGPPVPAPEVDHLVAAGRMGVRCARVAWSSRVRMAHGLADLYRAGRVFLAGDAAHVHSPAGGQGMNTGVQDAANLGWKLAYAAAGSPGPALLDSYELERRPVARTVSALTDLMFWAESGAGPVPSILRGVLAPLAAPVVPVAARSRLAVAEVVRLLGGLRVAYRDSPLSVQHARDPRRRAGERLPDATVSVDGGPVRLHELTARPGIHILLRRGAPPLRYPDRATVHVHRLDDWTGPALTVVRPDGYVGVSSDLVDDGEVTAWLALVGMAVPGPTRVA